MRYLLVLLAACSTTEVPDSTSPTGGKADDTTSTHGLPSVVWGGTDATKWRPEAILANAATAELAREPSARVSIPTAIAESTYSPFGDGQTNAAASLAGWQGTRPPVVGVRHAGGRVTVRFDRALPITDDNFELWVDGAWVRSIASTRVDGDWIVELGSVADRFAISPRGWSDRFALSFALPVSSINQLAGVDQHLPGGEPVIDPVGAAHGPAYEVLKRTSFPAGFENQMPYVTEDLHAAFPQSGAPRVTAVGGASTWVATTPWKNMYVCLDARSPAREAQYGVPSGAGWHRIGNIGETIVSSLEDSPLLIGYAQGASSAAAYGLDRATTFALLQPGQAFTTSPGEFHWYAVHQTTKPCVQIWAR